MKINKIQNDYQIKNIGFKRGLTNKFIVETNLANPKKIEKELLDKGIKANFQNNETIANCCKKTVEIMENYGFKLPKEFILEPLDTFIKGMHDSEFDRISLNSRKIHYQFLKALNNREEYDSSIGHSQKSGHFLQTYIHEFTHAAHFHNLQDLWGKRKGEKIYEILEYYEPNKIMLGFPYGITQKLCFNNKDLEEMLEFFIPAKNGTYAKSSLAEYIAEKNTRLVTKDLGKTLKLQHKNQPPILNPQNYYNNFEKILAKFQYNFEFIQELLELTSKYDKAIWNGELDKLGSLRKQTDKIFPQK